MSDEYYPPSEDTFLLLDAALEEVEEDDSVLEIGTGSGLIAEKLTDNAERVVATDINPHAVKEASSRGVEVIRTNLYDSIGSKFDLVVFNPPYLPTEEDERRDDWMEEALDGGETGREVIDEFLDGVERKLESNGRILLLVSSLTGTDEVIYHARNKGFGVEEVKEEKHFFERLAVLKLDLNEN